MSKKKEIETGYKKAFSALLKIKECSNQTDASYIIASEFLASNTQLVKLD